MTMPQYGNCPHKPGTWCIPCVAKAHEGWDEERKELEQKVADLRYLLSQSDAAIAMWDKASATWGKSLLERDAAIDALESTLAAAEARIGRLREALTAFIHLDNMRTSQEAPLSALSDACFEAGVARMNCDSHNDLTDTPPAAEGASDGA